MPYLRHESITSNSGRTQTQSSQSILCDLLSHLLFSKPQKAQKETKDFCELLLCLLLLLWFKRNLRLCRDKPICLSICVFRVGSLIIAYKKSRYKIHCNSSLCPERDSNPHVHRTHVPQTCLSTNFSTRAF